MNNLDIVFLSISNDLSFEQSIKCSSCFRNKTPGNLIETQIINKRIFKSSQASLTQKHMDEQQKNNSNDYLSLFVRKVDLITLHMFIKSYV